jgi:hypothetical protein
MLARMIIKKMNKALILGVVIFGITSCQETNKQDLTERLLGRWTSYERTTENGDTLMSTGIRTTLTADLEFLDDSRVKDYTIADYYYSYILKDDTLILGRKKYILTFKGNDTLVKKEMKGLLSDGAFIDYMVRYKKVAQSK